jgi:cell division septation protein DedD
MRAIAIAAVLVVVVLVIVYAIDSKTSQPSGMGGVASVLPATETSFIQAVDKARKDSGSAENDMQKGGIKAARDNTICSTLTSLEVPDWVGTVKTVDSNSDGKGVLEIEIAPNILVKTWNNALSDIGTDTLIQPGTPLFESASAMEPGQLVTFSGRFFPGMSGDCFDESSLTLDGKLQSPEFIFRFATLAKYQPPQQTSATQEQSKPAAAENSPSPDVNFDGFKAAAGSSEGGSAAVSSNSVAPDPDGTPAAAAPVVPTAAARTAPPAATASAESTATESFVVRIAAVSHREDAELLVNSLRARGYLASAHTEPQDKFFHIQVGPFNNREDTDAAKQRLLADGYQPIVK